MDDVAAAPEGTMDLPEDIEPKGAFGQDDPTKLKYAYDKSSDPTITEYCKRKPISKFGLVFSKLLLKIKTLYKITLGKCIKTGLIRDCCVDFCAGREKDVFNDDLVSCLMVGFGNESGLVEIRGDNSEIYINGKYVGF